MGCCFRLKSADSLFKSLESDSISHIAMNLPVCVRWASLLPFRDNILILKKEIRRDPFDSLCKQRLIYPISSRNSLRYYVILSHISHKSTSLTCRNPPSERPEFGYKSRSWKPGWHSVPMKRAVQNHGIFHQQHRTTIVVAL